ncbi:MAG: HEAT repeat domain-containing protein [Geminocystis sp.]|nr:HEAT repeat domain-containing protein [Geminocystis sp.]HIK37504.1 HEAT repeat domain-containing protein [Geminocystis sp. M7585_C2015_104]MCS7148905.1 HEAT repeat domain-containing protein [Geminocystis sp.]MCX8077460.1 HEAT repeat domain-containing protein [Geminocystis sp.]MDW8116990.1 HEAT repeat domain-containing protein [Geminocystis sp.]
MDLEKIELQLNSEDIQERIRAVTALQNYTPEVAVPLLLKAKEDEQFLVRSLVAMGLGRQKTAESFATLLEMLKFDRDTNVRAEASNSLSLFGEVSIPHLQQAFHQDDSWLVRLSILGAMMELNCPNELLDVCICGIRGDDYTVKETCVSCLGALAGTEKEEEALQQLLQLVDDESWRIRAKVAIALSRYNNPRATEALNKLKQDSDHRVVAAALEKEFKMGDG